MPFGDWQFWVVTIFAIGALWFVIRRFLPRKRADGGGCPSCPTGDGGSNPARSRKVRLTVDQRRV